jgi:hypothetical protein
MDVTFVICTQMNLYIFNENRRGSVYGIGTYIRELTGVLKKSDIHVTVVHLMSEKPYIQMEDIDGIKHWYFSAPIPDQQATTDEQEQRERYRQNIVYLLQLYIRDKENLIFHLNFSPRESLIEALKNVFECKIVSVVHYSDWGFTIFDNLQRLHKILKGEGPDSLDENVKNRLKEKKRIMQKRIIVFVCQITCGRYCVGIMD